MTLHLDSIKKTCVTCPILLLTLVLLFKNNVIDKKLYLYGYMGGPCINIIITLITQLNDMMLCYLSNFPLISPDLLKVVENN